MENVDCIDASVILGTLFEKEERCKTYINTVGYKLKNCGLLTIPLVGEIFTNMFLKIPQHIEEAERKVFLQSTIDFFDFTIMHLIQKNRLIIAKIKSGDYQFVKRINELDYKISDDDLLHLSSAINNNCQRFVTIDKVLLEENFRNNIKREFGMMIIEP